MGEQVTEQQATATENTDETTTEAAKDGLSALQLISKGSSKEEAKTVSEQKPGDEAKAKDSEKPATDPQPEAKPFKVYKTEDEYNLDLEKALTPKVQSAKDKELAPLQTKVSELTKENTKLKKDLTRKREDFQTEELEDSEAAEWGKTPEVKDFQTARRDINKRARAITDGEAELQDRMGRSQAVEEVQQSTVMAIKFLLGDKGDEFNKNLESLVKELSTCTTPREKELTLQVKGSQLTQAAQPETPKAEAEPKVVLKKIDSSRNEGVSVPDYSVISFSANAPSAQDMIRAGFKKKK